MLTTHSVGTPARNMIDVEKDVKISKLEGAPFGSPASNPLVEAARKALLNKDPSAVSSTGVMGSEAEIEQVQEVVNKDAKLSKLENDPFGAPAYDQLVKAAREALFNNDPSAVGSEAEIQQAREIIDKNAKLFILEDFPFGAPASNPLVEAARKALLNNNPSAVSSTGVMGSEAEIEQVQEVVNKDAKLSKLENDPFGASL